MSQHFWARIPPWRHKRNVGSNPAQINFSGRLAIPREIGWAYLELLLLNRSSRMVWVEEASIALADLDATWQSSTATGQATHEIRQIVGAKDALNVSLASAIYDAAGKPQGPYSCLVLTNVRYRVFDEWRNLNLETWSVEMAGLTAVALHKARGYDRKVKLINGSMSLTTPQHRS